MSDCDKAERDPALRDAIHRFADQGGRALRVLRIWSFCRMFVGGFSTKAVPLILLPLFSCSAAQPVQQATFVTQDVTTSYRDWAGNTVRQEDKVCTVRSKYNIAAIVLHAGLSPMASDAVRHFHMKLEEALTEVSAGLQCSKDASYTASNSSTGYMMCDDKTLVIGTTSSWADTCESISSQLKLVELHLSER